MKAGENEVGEKVSWTIEPPKRKMLCKKDCLHLNEAMRKCKLYNKKLVVTSGGYYVCKKCKEAMIKKEGTK